MSASIAIGRLFDLRPKAIAAFAGGAALLGCVAAGITFIAVIGTRVAGIPEYPFSRSAEPVPDDDTEAIVWLRHHVEPGRLVYRDRPESLAYAQWGGLPQVWTDDMVIRHAMPSAMLEDRARLLEELPADPDAWRSRGVTWFVLDPGDVHLNAVTATWVANGQAVVRVTFGSVRILELRPPNPA